jgi:protoporphyrin/coproporphyrin ferrochelatase
MADYDAFLLVSFGGPEGPDDVMPFLQNVTRGRGIPPARLQAVAEHYYAVGGVSPINQQCRDLIAAIGKDFATAGVDLPIYWGNRNWDPYLTETVAAMAAAGVRRALALVTSAYGSYSSCRQYLEDIERARAAAGPGAPQIDKIRHFYHHPGFIGPFADATVAAIGSLPPGVRDGVPLVFTAHSVPDTMAAASGPPPGGRYPAQLAEAAGLIAGRVTAATGREHPWRLVYQSRSGPPSQPWLGPDVCDYLGDLARDGAPGAVLVPVGFISDHLEVIHDLDVEAAETAGRLGLPLARAATPGTDPRFVAMVTALVTERLEGHDSPAALGSPGCGSGDCCRPPAVAGHPGRPAAAS